VEEDLIEATDQHQGLALGVQPCEDLAGRDAAAAWTQRWTVDRAGAALAPKSRASKTAIWVRPSPMARATAENSCCLTRGLDGQRQPIPKLGVFLAQGLVLLD
jgi:hypothetical protein